MGIPVSRWVGRLVPILLALCAWSPAAARADWTTYRGDSGRSGVDSSSVGSLPFAAAWTSPNLGGAIWGRAAGARRAGDRRHRGQTRSWRSTRAPGRLAWQASAGTPVPIQPAAVRGHLADRRHHLDAGDRSGHRPRIRRRRHVAGRQHPARAIRLQRVQRHPRAGVPGVASSLPETCRRTSCSAPRWPSRAGRSSSDTAVTTGTAAPITAGWSSVPEAGGPLQTFEVEPNGSEGAIWGSGNGPAVDSSGQCLGVDRQWRLGLVLRLSGIGAQARSSMHLLDLWAPSDWSSLDSGDLRPRLERAGSVSRRAGVRDRQGGSRLSALGLRAGRRRRESALLAAQVCSGSWGGGVYDGGIIYVSC